MLGATAAAAGTATPAYDGKGGGPPADRGQEFRIPSWDARPETFQAFSDDMDWFLAGEQTEGLKYNLAARIVG